jgi:hypothetical protein
VPTGPQAELPDRPSPGTAIAVPTCSTGAVLGSATPAVPAGAQRKLRECTDQGGRTGVNVIKPFSL